MSTPHGHTHGSATTHTDPVCGMTVNPETAAGSLEHAGTTYYFCSRHCLDKFRADPGHYVTGQPAPADHSCCGAPTAHAPARPRPEPASATASPGVKYTCPMHPEVIRDGPGTCPKCGMALEPMTPQAGEEDNAELRSMLWRFGAAVMLTLPVFVLAMAPMIPGVSLPHALISTMNWIGFALATPVVFIGGWPIFVRAVDAARHLTTNMFTLIMLGISAAWGYSTVATLAPDIFPPSFRDAHGMLSTYFEAAAVIVTLVLLGQVLELRARRSTGTAIRMLLGLAPKTARRLRDDGAEEDIPLEHVHAGDRLRVRPGEKVP